MTDRIPFFDFFDRFVPPRELRLMLHDAAVTGGVLNRAERTMELEVETGEALPDAAVEAVRQLLMEEYRLRQLRMMVRTVQPGKKTKDILMGKPIKGKPIPMVELNPKMGAIVLEGKVFAAELYETRRRGLWCLTFDMTDYKGSVTVRKYMEEAEAKPLDGAVKAGMWLRVQGIVELSRDGKDIQLRPLNITKVGHQGRKDTNPEKRVELHLHTRMSNMDALTDTESVIKQAIEWGHPAIAVTDHGVAQAFPDAWHTAKGKIKILYGIEGYFVNNLDDRVAVHGGQDQPFDDEIVCFDIETTGLKVTTEAITEIGAVVLKNGQITDTFQTFVNPQRRLTPEIIGLTGITDAMLADAPSLKEALTAFLKFVNGRPLAAHNAPFDISFIRAGCEKVGLPFDPTYVDSLILAQNLLPELHKYKLDIVADYLDLPAFNHHRASDDAGMVAYMLVPFFRKMRDELHIHRIQQINNEMAKLRPKSAKSNRFPKHIIILAKNKLGLKHLYQLITASNLQYFHRVPTIPKTELAAHREGLIIGSACEAGELFQAILNHKSWAELKRIASFYDFLEIQPICNNRFMLDKGLAEDEEELRGFNRTIVKLGEELGKPVVATGDVHFLDPEDEIFRHILLATKQMPDADRPLPLYLRTTDEMMEEFSYLGPEKAHEVVIENPNRIVDWCETLRPVPHNLFAPKIENSVEDLKALVYGKLHRLYGETPPELVQKRVDTEMHDIISCHYDVIYMSAQKLVQNSLEHGYLVGSRGSVGSSIVAFMSGITEVNSYPPHYRCPQCKFTTFEVPADCACGADLPDAVCPKCGAKLDKDGFNIPFETFLGFGGDKVPDIDLNFSGEYQAKAHAYCVQMFGKTHVFRAGTIGTVAEKTAYGYAKKYLSERNKTVPKAEENRLALGCVNVKRTTGQHPGGLVVIPQENEIWDFCPVQHPADDKDSEWITTHFEYHSMEENLLKLDMLGHDDPTMIRMLEDMTGVDAQKIPLDDQDTMSIFTSSKVLGYENDPILGPVGSVAIPEFGTGFTRGMLQETQPTKFDTLIRLSGFSHGTDVWLGNARDLILSKTASVNDAIGCRDDIMLYLIKCGMPEKRSFKIMEAVRKGRGLPDGAEEEMKAAGVPEWYIGSCKKIKYLFPKAHATAYVMMAFRIAWFKVHEPLAFYAAYFYRRSQKGGFDEGMMCHGIELVKKKLQEIKEDEDSSAKDDDLFTTLEVCYEFYLRGFTFAPIDIYHSHATKFQIEAGQLRPPFVAVAGLGETAAWDLMNAREGREFLSVEEFADACPKVSKTLIDQLQSAGAFGDLPLTSQLTLF
jgi:DNA polymerase-3 subunit alpha (Gram-positive type)